MLEHSVLLNKVCPQKETISLLGPNQLEEGKHTTSVPSSCPIPCKLHVGVQLRSTCEDHSPELSLIKRLRPNHKTIDLLALLHLTTTSIVLLSNIGGIQQQDCHVSDLI